MTLAAVAALLLPASASASAATPQPGHSGGDDEVSFSIEHEPGVIWVNHVRFHGRADFEQMWVHPEGDWFSACELIVHAGPEFHEICIRGEFVSADRAVGILRVDMFQPEHGHLVAHPYETVHWHASLTG